MPVVWWQLWNEPNFPSFWFHKPNAKQYVHLLRVFHGAVKGGDPSAKVVLAGLFPTPGEQVRRGIDLDPYLTAIYRHGGKKLFDAAAIHPYAGTTGHVPGADQGRAQDHGPLQGQEARPSG